MTPIWCCLANGRVESLDFGCQQRIRRLKRSDRRHFDGARHLLRVEVRDADIPNLAFGLEFRQLAHSLFNRPGRGRFRVALPGGPVDLIEIDRIEPQSLQAGFGFPSNGGRLQIVGNGPGFIPDQAALGEDIRTLAQPADGPADHFFRMSQPIDRGGIDPVDAPVKARMNGGDGLPDRPARPTRTPTFRRRWPKLRCQLA